MRSLPTPRLDSVADSGFLARVEVDAATPTMSGPCWATVVTGVDIRKHGVWSNHFAVNRLAAFPDFATRPACRDGRRTVVAAARAPLVLAHDGGPLFAAPGRLSYVAPCAERWDTCDEQVTAEAVHGLACDDPEVSFVCLGPSTRPRTRWAVRANTVRRYGGTASDERLGRVLAAVRGRTGYEQEAWNVIVVTDHGHVDAGGHGGDSAEERTAWVACCGPASPADRPHGHCAMPTSQPGCTQRPAASRTRAGPSTGVRSPP